MDNMKVYQMNDVDWVASDLNKEDTNKWYMEQIGLEEWEQQLSGVVELDLDSKYLLLIDEPLNEDGTYQRILLRDAIKGIKEIQMLASTEW